MAGKGEARRAALVEAAAELLTEQGFEGTSHRTIAARAGVPLAATTYYFASLEELLSTGADTAAARDLDRAAAVVARLPDRPASAHETAVLVVELLLAGRPAPELTALFSRYLQAGRSEPLRAVVQRWNAELRNLVAAILHRTGHVLDADLAVAAVDGLVVTALAEGSADPVGVAVDGLTRMLAR